ncbi:MAG: protein kinase [Planctomycetota bacterium]|nr:MAG: protein kinase [Planctomycetota bacterium]
MAEERKDIKIIFSEALEITDTAKRAAYIEQACGEDNDLRAEVEALLSAHEGGGNFLKPPVCGADATVEESAVVEGPGTRIGRYEVLELIGEGGMGLVYLAEQKEPVRRRVALKILKPGMDSKQVIARFEAERQVLALLDHPNIAHVFDAGTTEAGRPYFVMEYVRGMSITEYSDERKLSIEQRLRLFEQVCEAVQHAHQKGIIHRDLKPTNVLISLHGDRALPKIIDFGIAKAVTQPLTDKTFVTIQGQLLGTPEYMSPEQVDLATQDIDTRSDIYSLGVVLYELLAGVLPFEHESLKRGGFAEVQRTIREQEPASPSIRLTNLGERAKTIAASRNTQVVTLARRLHRELEWIPLKAMRKDRCRRYRSASAMADDVRNYLNGLPLIAGPETVMYRTKKFVRKHAGSVVTAALVAAVIVLGLIISTMMYFRAEKALQKEAVARTQAEEARSAEAKQRQIAEERSEEYRQLSYVHGVALADAKYRERNLRSTRKLLESCPEDLRNWEWYRLNYVVDESIITFGHDGEGAVAIAFSPDGERIATGYATITIWDAATGTEIRTLKGHEAAVVSLAFSPDGERIISGSMDGLVKVWNASSGEEIMTLEGHEAGKGIAAVDLSSDGKQIVSIDYDGIIKVWDADGGEELLTIHAILSNGEYGRSVAISPDGKRIAAGRNSKKVHEWDAATGEKLRTFSMQDQSVFIVEYSPDGKRIAMGCGSGMIKIVDMETEKETILTEGKGWSRSLVMSLAFSPDSKRLVSGGYDHMVRVWDTNTGKELTTLVGHPAPIDEVAFSPDGQRIASAAYGGKSRIWDPGTDRESKVLKGHTATIRDVAFTPDGKQLISVSRDKTIKMWDVSKGEVIHTFSGHKDSIWSMAMSPDGRHIVSGSGDNTIRIWDIDSGEQVRKITGHDGAVFSVVFSPDGKRIVSGGKDKKIRVWNASTGEESKTLSGHESGILSVAFSKDGKRIVSGCNDGTIKVWDESTGEELMTLSGHNSSVRSVVFTPNGKRIVSGSYDATIRIWDAETGDELTVLYGHNRNVEAVAVSLDGKRIVSGSFLTAKVWDADTGVELMTLPSNSSFAIAFSPDGKTIAGAGDEEIILWESGLEKR